VERHRGDLEADAGEHQHEPELREHVAGRQRRGIAPIAVVPVTPKMNEKP
jgi:hypothetical protein